MTLAVNLSDGSIKYMEADSAITAEEVCSQLADHIGMQDRFGFSLFISVFGEVRTSKIFKKFKKSENSKLFKNKLLVFNCY